MKHGKKKTNQSKLTQKSQTTALVDKDIKKLEESLHTWSRDLEGDQQQIRHHRRYKHEDSERIHLKCNREKNEQGISKRWDNFRWPSGCIFGVLKFLLAGRRQEDRENICRNIGQIFPKFVENYKLTNPGSSMYPKYKKYEEKYTKEPHDQTA